MASVSFTADEKNILQPLCHFSVPPACCIWHLYQHTSHLFSGFCSPHVSSQHPACGNLVPLYGALIFRYINSEGQITIFRNSACRQYLCLIRRSSSSVVTLIEPALSPVCCGSSLSELSSVAVSVICDEPLASFFADLITKCGNCSQCSYYRNNYKYCYYLSFIVHRFSSSLFIYVTMYRQSAFMQQNISYNPVIFKYLSFFRKY